MFFKSGNEFVQSVYSSSSLSRLKDLLSHLNALSILCMFLSILVVLLIICRRKIKIMSIFHSELNNYYSNLFIDEFNENDKPFDCFISYCLEDKEAVADILQALEKKPPYYNFCTRERNWAPLSYIPTNVFLSVQNSRKTLMILSEAFLKTPWFHLQFQVAFHQALKGKGHRLMLVLKDLPEKTQLPRDVQYFVDTRSNLKWGDTWFWDRLKYSLEDDEGLICRRYRRDLKNTINNVLNNNESMSHLFKDHVV